MIDAAEGPSRRPGGVDAAAGARRLRVNEQATQPSKAGIARRAVEIAAENRARLQTIAAEPLGAEEGVDLAQPFSPAEAEMRVDDVERARV